MKVSSIVQDQINRMIAEGEAVEILARKPPEAAPPKLPRGMKEAEFQQWFEDTAHQYGWLVAHFRPARVVRGGKEIYETAVSADGKGFPDNLCIRLDRIMVVELKCGRNKPSKEQEAWLKAFREAAVEVYVWYPEDEAEIIKNLKGKYE